MQPGDWEYWRWVGVGYGLGFATAGLIVFLVARFVH